MPTPNSSLRRKEKNISHFGGNRVEVISIKCHYKFYIIEKLLCGAFLMVTLFIRV